MKISNKNYVGLNFEIDQMMCFVCESCAGSLQLGCPSEISLFWTFLYSATVKVDIS